MKNESEICGEKSQQNPKGGNPPYSFNLGKMQSFPPVAIYLTKNGILAGKPFTAGTYAFEVCAKDEDGKEKCGQTSLTILPSAPPPPPIPTPECTEDGNCPTGLCSNGKCKQCTFSSDCHNFGKCLFGSCWYDAECRQNSDCRTSRCEGNKCTGCEKDSQCPNGYCDKGYCKERKIPKCTSNNQCGKGICFDGICTFCLNDSECGTGQVCNLGYCADFVQCKNNSACPTNLCVDNKCRVCRNDSDCGKGDMGYCDDFICKEKINPVLTYTSGTCEIVEQYTGDARGVLRMMGAHYARMYRIKVSGHVEAPTYFSLSLSTSPTVGGPDSQLSCGGWESDKVMRKCTRKNDTFSSSMDWYYMTDAYGEHVNVNPNFEITIQGELTKYDSMTRLKKNYTITCPKVDY